MQRAGRCVVVGGWLLLAACDGGSAGPQVDANPMASTHDAGDATGGDVPAETEPALPDAAAGTAPERPPLPDLIGQSLPADVAPPRRIVPGDVRLIGWGASACTHQNPASGTGDRWCGFRRTPAGATDAELWVINLTAAASGTPPPCDGSSPNCLRLSTKLWTAEVLAGPSQDVAHRFDGDTLIFTAGGSSGSLGTDSPYNGPIWAWRPGWPSPRALTDSGLTCYGHARVAVAQCVTNLVYQGFSPTELDITAGPIADHAGPPLAKIDRARVWRSDNQRGFWTTMSDAGDAVVFSAVRAEDPATASLRVALIAEAGTVKPREVVLDAMNWGLSNDQTKFYYFNHFADRFGTLMMADFPSGANPVQLVKRTSRYVILGEQTTQDRGIGYFVESTGRFLSEYRVIADRADPLNSKAVFRYAGTLEGFRPSGDARYTAYGKLDRVDGYAGYIARNDGNAMADCRLSTDRDRLAFTTRFLEKSGMVFWAEDSYDDSGQRDGWLAAPEGCQNRQRFAAHLAFHNPVGDEGLLFGDDLVNETVTLRYAKIENGRDWPAAGATQIRAKVALPVVMPGPQRNRVLFRVASDDPAEAGLYLFDGLPFTGAN